jgi:hypothetical protein
MGLAARFGRLTAIRAMSSFRSINVAEGIGDASAAGSSP